MNHGSLFSGIGGFDLAAEWMDWNNVFHCEWNEFGQNVLKYYWPKAISYADITQTDFTIHRGTIDILTGGFPCQPYSTAGKRLGKEDDRHLWPEMLRAIREIQPTWIVGENVRGLVNWNGGLVFDEVQADLEAEGYEVTPFLLPACAVNAPHRRDRIWFIAHSNNQECNRGGSPCKRKGKKTEYRGDRVFGTTSRFSEIGIVADPGSQQLQERSQERNCKDQTEERTGVDNRSERSGDTWDVADRSGAGRKELHLSNLTTGEGYRPGSNHADGNGFDRFPTQSPVCSRNDGLYSRMDGITFSKWRNESIKAAGNAIVPQVVLEIFKAIEQHG